MGTPLISGRSQWPFARMSRAIMGNLASSLVASTRAPRSKPSSAALTAIRTAKGVRPPPRSNIDGGSGAPPSRPEEFAHRRDHLIDLPVVVVGRHRQREDFLDEPLRPRQRRRREALDRGLAMGRNRIVDAGLDPVLFQE